MTAVTMPLFVFADFVEATTTWVLSRPLLSLFLLTGTVACGFVALLWQDTREDERGEMEDTEPRVRKVVQFTGQRPYTDMDYHELVARVEDGEEPEAVIRRINERWAHFEREQRENREARRKGRA